MLLAIDVGNSNLFIGLFDGDRLLSTWRLTTDRRTADEYGIPIKALVDNHKITQFCAAGVVPFVVQQLAEMSQRVFGLEAISLSGHNGDLLPVDVDNPNEVGIDRILNAVAAVPKYGKPLIIVDMGTATTFDVIDANGAYVGGVIAPGIYISADALFRNTALLPKVPLVAGQKIIGRNTITCVQAGIVRGQAALVQSVVEKIRDEMGVCARVIATGGAAPVILPHVEILETYDPELILHGIRIAVDKFVSR